MQIYDAVCEARKIAERHNKTLEQLLTIAPTIIKWQTPPFSATGFQRQVFLLLHQLLLTSRLKRAPMLEQFRTAIRNTIDAPPCGASLDNPKFDEVLFCIEPSGHDKGDSPTSHRAELDGKFTTREQNDTKNRTIPYIILLWD